MSVLVWALCTHRWRRIVFLRTFSPIFRFRFYAPPGGMVFCRYLNLCFYDWKFWFLKKRKDIWNRFYFIVFVVIFWTFLCFISQENRPLYLKRWNGLFQNLDQNSEIFGLIFSKFVPVEHNYIEMMSYFEQFFNFINKFTIDSYEVNHQNAQNYVQK